MSGAELNAAASLAEMTTGDLEALGRFKRVPQPLTPRSEIKVPKEITADEALHRVLTSKNHQHHMAKLTGEDRQAFIEAFGKRWVGAEPFQLTTVDLAKLNHRQFKVNEAKVSALMKDPPPDDGNYPLIGRNDPEAEAPHLILDGNHRVEAAKRRGDESMTAYVQASLVPDLTTGSTVAAMAGIATLTLQAMGVEMPEVTDHPNRHPFKGVLTILDEPSTRPPSGSGGHRIILPRAVAEAALPTLIGMAVDWDGGTGHDPQAKIGIITSADVAAVDGGKWGIAVEGFLYALDFPEAVAEIRALRPVMGMSYELANVAVEDTSANDWTLTACTFTGAAILRKDKAAYQATSLAAAADKENGLMEETLKELLAATQSLGAVLTAQGETLSKLAASADKTNEILASVAKEEQEKPHGDSADGGAKPSEKGEVKAKAKKEDEKVDDEKADADMDAKALKAEVEALKAEMSAIKAQATQSTSTTTVQAAAEEPARRTMSPEISSILAKAGVIGPSQEADSKLKLSDLDAALSKAGVDTVQRIAAKSELARIGAIDPQA